MAITLITTAACRVRPNANNNNNAGRIAASSWSSYFPFSIFGSGKEISSGGLDESSLLGGGGRRSQIVFNDLPGGHQSSGATFGFSANDNRLDYGALEHFVNLIAPANGLVKASLVAIFRRLIMLINSMLGKYKSAIRFPQSLALKMITFVRENDDCGVKMPPRSSCILLACCHCCHCRRRRRVVERS